MCAGKSSLAEHLKECLPNRIITPLAYGVRQEVEDALMDKVVPLYAPPEIVATLQELAETPEEELMAAIWSKPTSPAVRKLLQWWGTDFRRAEDQNYWIRKHKIRTGLQFVTPQRQTYDKKFVIIDDIRFLNEIDYVRRTLQGKVFWLDRRSVPRNDHESELDWSAYCNGIIDSNGSLADLFKSAKEVMSAHNIIF